MPKDFTPEQRPVWTIVVNGVSNSIPLRLHTDYISLLKIHRSDLQRIPDPVDAA